MCASFTLLLGIVTRRLDTLAIDASAARLFHGRGVRAAWIFTVTGYSPTLIVTYVAMFALALGFHRSIVELGALATAQVLSQTSVRAIKTYFKRVRPENWLLKREGQSSFPSGHAATAAVTFAGIVLLLWRSSLPHELKLWATLPPGIFAVGIGWSRLALSAHYFTDVLGGYALGAAWLCATVAVLEAYGV